MINIENELFTKIATALRTTYSGIYVTNEYVSQPPRFPAVFIVEQDNAVNRAYRDSSTIENFSDVMYQVDVYSNRNQGRHFEAKGIMAAIDDQFAALGFTRTFLSPVPNMHDATIYRMTARYTATVGRNNYIYNRR